MNARIDSNVLLLRGCRSTPLAGYLKALAVLRLVAEQADPRAVGRWRGDVFELKSVCSQEDLREFFLSDYRPSPIVAPWNGGSGFYPKDNTEAINTITQSASARLEKYRKAISLASRAVAQARLSESPKDKAQKATFLTILRNTMPDSALRWMDAAVTLTAGDTRYPPLLGTGGNDGRLDFTNNFMQRLLDVIGTDTAEPKPVSGAWFQSAVLGTAEPGLSGGAIGQFAPGRAGGPNAGFGYDASAASNPWDFVLMLEGALLFAAAATRRLGGDSTALSFPFTVKSTGAGFGGVRLEDERQARAELWLPLWEQPATLGEVETLLREGRATVGRRMAVDGLDFSRAVAQLAVDRGVSAFQRFSLLQRAGKAYLALPATRVDVPPVPRPDLIAELDRHNWLSRFRRLARKATASRLLVLGRRLDNLLFELAIASDERGTHLASEALSCLGEIHQYCAVSPAVRDELPPIPTLSRTWATKADDGSDESGIARALAVLGTSGSASTESCLAVRLRTHIAPETPDCLRWSASNPKRYVVWGNTELPRALADVLLNRLLRSTQLGVQEGTLSGERDRGAGLTELASFLTGQFDDRRAARLAVGFSLCDVPGALAPNASSVPAAAAMTKLLAIPATQLSRVTGLPTEACPTLPARLVRLLQAGRAEEALVEVTRRLRLAGFGQLPVPSLAGIDSMRLAAALLIPLRDESVSKLLRQLGVAKFAVSFSDTETQ